MMSLSTVALSLALMSSAGESAPPAPAGPATKVFIGTHIVEMRNVDVRSQSFYADFYLWLRFTGADDARTAEIIDKLEPVNGAFESKSEIDRKVKDGQTYVCYRITGTFFYEPDLRLYPFDTQMLPIELENAYLASDEMVFVDDKDSYARSGEPEARWGVNRGIHVPEYVLENVERKTVDAPYPTNFGDPERLAAADQSSTYSRFNIEITFVREYWSYAFKILIPLLIILAMVYVVFWIPASRLDIAAPVAMTSLLTCMAYNVAVTQNLPDVGYLVLSDKFFIATYLLLLFTLVSVFVVFRMDARHQEAAAKRAQRFARVVFPLLVAMIFGFFVARAI